MNEWGIELPPPPMEEVVTPKTKKKSIFDIIGSTYNKRYFASDEDINSSLNEFMLVNILSNHPATIFLAEYLNNHNMPLPTAYRFIYHSIPKGAIRNILYPSNKKSQKNISEDEIEVICKHYKCNEVIAQKYFNILPKEELDKIVDMYAEGGIVNQ